MTKPVRATTLLDQNLQGRLVAMVTKHVHQQKDVADCLSLCQEQQDAKAFVIWDK
jgi:hypothetical protein